jgi:class 3 adenylate cyclase
VLRERQYAWRASMLAATRAYLHGELAAAERHAQDAFAVGQAMGESNALQAFALQIGLVRREQGRTAEIAPAVESMVERFPGVAAWRLARAVVWLDLRREEAAREELRALAAQRFAAIPRDYLWVASIAGAAELAVAFADADAAACLSDALQPLAGGFVVTGDGVAVYGSVNLTLGRLAQVLGNRGEARALLEESVAVHDRIRAPIFAGRARLALAELLLEDAGGRERALALLDGALEAARRGGSRLLAERVIQRKLAALGVEANLSTSIDAVASRVEERRPDLRPHAARDGFVTLLFTDVEDFSLMTERLGDRESHRVMQLHHDTIRRELARYGGFEVEVLGDGFVVAFAEESRALRCAVAIQRAFAALGARGGEPLRVRMGVHSGAALQDADRFFGKTVIVAARIAALARGGQILVSRELWQRVCAAPAGGPAVEFVAGPSREVGLKGLAGRYGVLEVDWSAGHRAA